MDRIRKQIYVQFKNTGITIMEHIRIYRETHCYDSFQYASIVYEFYRLIYEIILNTRKGIRYDKKEKI